MYLIIKLNKKDVKGDVIDDVQVNVVALIAYCQCYGCSCQSEGQGDWLSQ